MIYRPVRERDPVAVLDALLGGVKKGGYDETALTSLSTADYSCVTPLVKAAMARLGPERVSLSVSSLRAYGLNEDLLGEMASVRAGGLTFAPEAGTQRMRDVVAKNVTEEDILESAHRVFGRGFSRMKLYFMIGLPTETDEDVLGIVETTARVQEIGRRYQRGAQVTASVSTHVPKPHTPFQWAAMDGEQDVARKQALLAARARALRVNLKMHENHASHIEGIFSRGDRRVADVLEAAFRLGCRFDSWDDALRVELWDRAIAETVERTGMDIGRYMGTLPVSARLPWSHIDIGLEDDFLAKEYRKALKDRLSPPCGKPFKKLLHPSSVAAAEEAAAAKLICYDCGIACDLGAMKEERLFYLRRMNAWLPSAPKATTERPSEDGKEAGHRRTTPPPKRAPQGTPYRYRLRYTKLGRVAFLGHLDLVRHLPRIFRRAGFSLFYSEGFHPKPELSYGPALGLGIPSLGELCDVTMLDDVAPDELLRRLARVTLDGIEFLEAARLGPADRPVGGVIAEAEYAARLPDDVDVASAFARAGGNDPMPVLRTSEKKIARMIDVRKTLLGATPWDDGEARRRLDWDGGQTVSFRIAVGPQGSARPSEALTALFGEDIAGQADVARLGLRAGIQPAPEPHPQVEPAAAQAESRTS
jgi:radical SAM-linked protein